MNTDETRVTEINAKYNDDSATNAKSARNKNIRSNANRVKWHKNSDIQSNESPNDKVDKVLQEHKDPL